MAQAIACNSTAYLDDSDPSNVVALGNPTEGALLRWLRDAGIDYMAVRESCETSAQLPFSTLTKFMATVIKRPDGKRALLLKGAPEIVMGLCGMTRDDALYGEVTDELIGYQTKAMPRPVRDGS